MASPSNPELKRSGGLKRDYSLLDRPEILPYLFHPRPELPESGENQTFEEILIPVDHDVVVGARFYGVDKKAPVLLFFHGNGEIVSDYSDLAEMYGRMNVNFFPMDYRGYGKSTGRPSVSAMMNDCHSLFTFAMNLLDTSGYTGSVVVMGRSLGSACALELVDSYKERIGGLIIESGFAFLLPLLSVIGVNAEALGIREEDGVRNYQKIGRFDKPTLIIHAEFDHIIPFTDGQTLFDGSPDAGKRLLKITGANHNDILARGINEYIPAVKELIERAIVMDNR